MSWGHRNVFARSSARWSRDVPGLQLELTSHGNFNTLSQLEQAIATVHILSRWTRLDIETELSLINKVTARTSFLTP